MPPSSVSIHSLSASEAEPHIEQLADVLIDVVQGGASVGLMTPISRSTALAFWHGVVASLARGERLLLAARDEKRIIGSVQVILALPENQPHRGEIAKLQVRRDAQRQGVGAGLMAEAERLAAGAGKTLLALDTTNGEAAERLYLAQGWVRFGIMPGHALYPDGRISDTSFFYKQIG